MAKIATWLFNEGAGTVVSDSEGNGNGIVVNFNGNGAWDDNGQGFGVSSTRTPGTGGATTAQLLNISANGNIGSSLAGATGATIYLVADVTAGSGDNPNLFRIGPSNGFSDISVVLSAQRAVTVRWGRDSDSGGELVFPNLSVLGSPAQNEAVAIMVKVDTTQASVNARARVWYNGTEQNVVFNGVPIPQNTALNSINSADRGVYFLNDGENDTKNLRGIIRYGQIFDELVSDAQIASDSAALLLNNDADPTGSDSTPPVLSSPTGVATSDVAANGTVSTNEGNGTLFYIASTNAVETVATVKAAASQAVSSSGVQSVSVTGLTATTNYFFHFVHTDSSSNDSTVSTSAQFTTQAPGDVTAPVLTLPTALGAGQTVANGTVVTDEANGTLHSLISTNAVETKANIVANGQTQAVTATGSQSIIFQGLTPSTVYYMHFVHVDASSNQSNVAVTNSITTATPAFTITSITPATLRVGDTATINLVGAQASGKTLFSSAGQLSIDSQDATTITFTVPDPVTFGSKSLTYGSPNTITVFDSSGNDASTFTISIPTTNAAFGEVTTKNSGGLYANDTDLQIGDFVYWELLTGTGVFDPASGLSAVSEASTARYAAYRDSWSDFEPIVYTNPVVVSAPTVTSQPVSRTLQEGSGVSVAFMVAFSGLPTPAIQWQKDDKGNGVFANISGQTSGTINIQGSNVNVLDNNGDRYRAVATNTEGTATSVQVILTVTAPAIEAPAFTGLIGTQSNTIGDNVYLDFSASWDGSPTAYAITSSVLPSNLSISNAGVVSGPLDTVQALQGIVITASNSAGSSSSNAFSWEVNGSITNPTFIGSIANRTNVIGDAVSFDLSPNWVNNPSAYAVTSSSLPTGLSVSNAGLVFGNVTAAGLSTGIVITATNSAGSDSSNAFSWNVTAAAIDPNATVVGVVDVSGNQVNRVYTDWYLTDSNINASNKAGQNINVVSSGNNLSVINGTATVAAPGATPGQTYTLVAWISGTAQNASTHYFRDVNVTITAGS